MGTSRRKLASALAKLEGKKSETAIGNIRETLKLLCGMIAKEYAMNGGYSPTHECLAPPIYQRPAPTADLD